MKKSLTLFFFLGLLMAFSCQKSETVAPENTAELKFISLVAADTVMIVNGINSITANVSGEGLSYRWTASYGTIIGSGPSVKWTVCHSDTFKITCEVTDKYDHTASKDLNIKVLE
jgi:hypothetical protein